MESGATIPDWSGKKAVLFLPDWSGKKLVLSSYQTG